MTIDPTRNITRQLLADIDETISWVVAMQVRRAARAARMARNIAEAYRPEGVP